MPFSLPTQPPMQPQGYGNNASYQGQPGQGWNNTNGAYEAPAGAPPPAYPGKETYPGQGAAPQPGGFAPPPGPPPAAYTGNGAGTVSSGMLVMKS